MRLFYVCCSVNLINDNPDKARIMRIFLESNMRYLVLVVAIMAAGASATTVKYEGKDKSRETAKCIEEAKKRGTKKTFIVDGNVCKLKKVKPV